MPYTITYYSERVRREIYRLPVGIKADYRRLLDLLMEFGPDLRLPHSRAMGGGLFELRPRGREGIGRVFYCMRVGREIIVLHGFVKKTQETPRAELETAQRRMKEVKDAQG